MFDKLQQKLLLQYPLLWNTKFVPMLAVGLLLHLAYFGFGFLTGGIDFSRSVDDSSFIQVSSDGIIYCLAILLNLLLIIVWLVFYLKNNAFKSFYPKSKNALFYEWLQIFGILLLISSFTLTFGVGKNLRKQTYFSQTELKQRMETIAKADFFINGTFQSPPKGKIAVEILGKNYPVTALINRQVYHFGYTPYEWKEESFMTMQMRQLLADNQQEALKKVMADYLNIYQESGLSTNLDLPKWWAAVYHGPEFTKYQIIKPYNPKFAGEYRQDEPTIQVENLEDQSNEIQNLSIVESQVADSLARNLPNPAYSHYYLDKTTLNQNYADLQRSYLEPFDTGLAIVILNICLFLSMLIFSFRVTSGKSWLITLVVAGVMNFCFGLLSIGDGSVYPVLYLLSIVVGMALFCTMVWQKKTVMHSKIIINYIIWFAPSFLLVAYGWIINLIAYPEDVKDNFVSYNELNALWPHLSVLNVLVCILLMYFLSKGLRIWKALPQE
jgi:hypothetical protein